MVDSRIKILVSFLLIIGMTAMKHWYFPIAVSVLCVFFALELNIFRDYCRKLFFPVVLGLFIFTIQVLTYGVNTIDLGFISIYSEGIDYGFLIFARLLASASIMVILILSTSENDILESLRWFRVPGTIVQISLFMSRYIKTFSNEGKKLRLAHESRCGFSKKLSYRSRMINTASICGALITRAFARSEEVYRAMISRAWTPELQYSDELPLNKKDMVLGITLFSGIIVLIGIDRFL